MSPSHLVKVVEVADVTLLGRDEREAHGEQGAAEGSHACWWRERRAFASRLGALGAEDRE